MSHVAVCQNCMQKVGIIETLIPDYQVTVDIDTCAVANPREVPVGQELPYDKYYRAPGFKDRQNHRIHVCKKADERGAE